MSLENSVARNGDAQLALAGPRLHKQRGVTLVEGLLVLGVSAMLAVGAYGAYKFALSDVSAGELGRGAVTLASQIKRTFGASGAYTGVTANAIRDTGLIPTGWKHDGTAIRDNFGNVVTITGAAASFAMVFQDLNSGDCSKVIPQFAGASYKLNVGTAATATDGAISGGSVYKAADGTVTAASMASGCSEAGRKIAMEVR